MSSRTGKQLSVRLAAAALGAVLLGSLVSCSSSGGQASPAGSTEPSAQTTQTAGSNSTDADPFSSNSGNGIGQFFFSEQGATVTTDVTVDPPTLGRDTPPPDDVLDGCNWNYGGVTAKSAFVHGTLDIKYQGAVEDEITIDPEASVRSLTSVAQFGGGNAGDVGIQDFNGDWHCGAAGDSWLEEMQPGASETVDWWGQLQVITNAQPTLSQTFTNSLAVQWFAYGQSEVQYPNAPRAEVTGFHAASCTTPGGNVDAVPTLLLYARAPADYEGNDTTGAAFSVRCGVP